MTIIQAINRLDALMHNTYTQADKIQWLSRLDAMVKKLVIDTHVGAEDISFTGYDLNTSPDTLLLVSAPFEEIYLRWMEAQIHYHNGEYERYNNAISMFNTEFSGFQDSYNRRNSHKDQGRRFLF